MNKVVTALAILLIGVGLIWGALVLADIAANGCNCLMPPCWCEGGAQ